MWCRNKIICPTNGVCLINLLRRKWGILKRKPIKRTLIWNMTLTLVQARTMSESESRRSCSNHPEWVRILIFYLDHKNTELQEDNYWKLSRESNWSFDVTCKWIWLGIQTQQAMHTVDKYSFVEEILCFQSNHTFRSKMPYFCTALYICLWKLKTGHFILVSFCWNSSNY